MMKDRYKDRHRILSYSNKRNFISFIMLLFIIISSFSIFTMNKAYADNFTVCKEITYIADNSSENYKDDISNKLRTLGVERIDFINSDTKHKTQSNECIIVDYQIEKDKIQSTLNTLNESSAEGVLLATPTYITGSHNYDNYLDYISAVGTYKPEGSKINIIDFSDMATANNFNQDGSLNKQGENNKANDLVTTLIGLQGKGFVPNEISNNTVSVINVQRSDPNGVGTSPKEPYVGENIVEGTYEKSPRETADNIQKITSMEDALYYIAGKRWATMSLPGATSSGSLLNSINNIMTNHVTNLVVLGITTVINTVGADFTAMAFSGSVLNIFTNFADYLFGTFTKGGVSGDGATGTLAAFGSSLFLLTIIMAIIKSFNPREGGTLNSRTREAGIGIARVALIFGMLLMMSLQSSKNHGANAVEHTGQALVNEVTGNDKQLASIKNINDPRSWAPASLGFFMSFTYYIVNIVVGAGTQMMSAVMVEPINALTNSITQAQSNNPNSFGFACDRYVDSMHQAFMNTQAAAGNKPLADLLVSIDLLSLKLYAFPYSYAYGGTTSTAQNSWCSYAELVNGVPATEQAVIARGAGLYKEALGAGNLFGDSGRYNSGAHFANVAGNLKTGLDVKGGILVNAEGEWVFNRPVDSEKKLEEFFGGSGGDGQGTNASLYYRAACVWDPEENWGRLSDEWKDVRAMGFTGGINGQTLTKDNMILTVVAPLGHSTSPLPEGKDNGIVEAAFEEPIRTVANGTNKDGSSNAPLTTQDFGGDFGTKKNRLHTALLNDTDCTDPALFAVGWHESSRIFGFNGENERAKRWNYAAPNGGTLMDQIKNTIDNIVKSSLESSPLYSSAKGALTAATKAKDWTGDKFHELKNGVFPGAVDQGDDGKVKKEENKEDKIKEDDERLFNPMYKFGANNNGDLGAKDNLVIVGNIPKSPAAEYWIVRNGNNAVPALQFALVGMLMTIINSLLFVVIILAAMILNFFLSISFVFIPVLIIVSLIIMAIKGGRT